ncbi:MAG: BNR repeat-containing protein [Cytophagales bacterium]|nr:BNR repeat-containing protein [Cytophagales bacterium]
MKVRNFFFICAYFCVIVFEVFGQFEVSSNLVPIAEGYAQTSVNATVFRKNSVSTFDGAQYVAFYDDDANVVLAKRKLNTSSWKINKTQYQGNVKDAHNVICIIHDGEGYLHVAWDHHNHPLRYAVSLEPESMELGHRRSMTGKMERQVTYPEFYKLKNGDLIFMFRDGVSGSGNLVMNYYNLGKKKWQRVQDNLIDGEGARNAYWQMAVDDPGTIHLSWVWRETGDVATNHDLCYARSRDYGKSWENSRGEKYVLPINAANAEYALLIPQNSNLINQTSMTADRDGNPYIATYFRGQNEKATQYKVIYNIDGKWRSSTVSQRKTKFDLAGGGTKSIPISRPQILISHSGRNRGVHLIYRDEAFDNRICLASSTFGEPMNWHIREINDVSMNRWEPSYDIELWRSRQLLHIYHQQVNQGDAETAVESRATMVGILEVDF